MLHLYTMAPHTPRRYAVIAATVLLGWASASLAARSSSALLVTDRYRVFSHGCDVDPAALEDIARRRDRLFDRVEAFMEGGEAPPRINYRLYPSFEAKGLSTRNTQLTHVQARGVTVHMVWNDWIHGDDARGDAALLIRHHLGAPATRILETGLAVYFSEEWRGRGYEYWAIRLFESENVLPLRDLLDDTTFAQQSYLVAQPLAGTFVAWLLDRYGREVFLDGYAEWLPEPGEIDRLEKEWHRYLGRLARRHDAQIRGDRGAFPRVHGFQKGFCHAHEGYRIHNGYLSKKSDEALAKLAELGTNAVSITPFTYMPDPRRPSVFPFSNQAGAENDESVIHATHTAHTLGMAVMLKPHIWAGHSWPGEIEMQNAADWERFFENYYRWILHYALLAEMTGTEILCVGVEMAKATVGHEAEWASIIDKLRGVYSGALTYAANWGQEFETVSFWDRFDFAGINSYYPLSDLEAPTDDDLKAGAEAMAERIETVYRRYHKPVVVTEIGFTSTSSPWRNPHEFARGKPVNLEHQASCYEAVFEALFNRKWCAGIYWWKWPSFLEFGGPGNPGFTPNNKPAEKIVEKWYRQ
jgi:arabinogalactan endo-1,4-beta-galactosidase